MAFPVSVPVTWVNTGESYDAGELRRADSAGFVSGGVVRASDTTLAVTVDGSDNVTVQGGAVAIDGASAVAGAGFYRFALASSTTNALTARHATNGRIDLIVARAMDTDVVPAHGAFIGRIDAVAGTPSATPAAPTLPSMAVELGRITVPASGGGAGSVDATYRTYACAPGGVLEVPHSGRLPATAPIWQKARALTTGYEYRFDGSAWLAWDTVWANLTKDAVMTSGTLRYRVKSGWVIMQADGAASTPPSASTTITASTVPAAYRPSVQMRSGAYLGGYAGVITVGTDGNVAVANYTGATRASVSGIVSYPVE